VTEEFPLVGSKGGGPGRENGGKKRCFNGFGGLNFFCVGIEKKPWGGGLVGGRRGLWGREEEYFKKPTKDTKGDRGKDTKARFGGRGNWGLRWRSCWGICFHIRKLANRKNSQKFIASFGNLKLTLKGNPLGILARHLWGLTDAGYRGRGISSGSWSILIGENE